MQEVNLKMADEFENGVSAFNQFELSDQFNEGMPVHSIAPAMRRDPEQAAIISRGRPVDVNLMRLRAENPFVQIVEPPISSVNALLTLVNNYVVFDIPDQASLCAITWAGTSNSPFCGTLASFTNMSPSLADLRDYFSITGALANGLIDVRGKKQIAFKYVASSGNGYVAVSFFY